MQVNTYGIGGFYEPHYDFTRVKSQNDIHIYNKFYEGFRKRNSIHLMIRLAIELQLRFIMYVLCIYVY